MFNNGINQVKPGFICIPSFDELEDGDIIVIMFVFSPGLKEKGVLFEENMTDLDFMWWIWGTVWRCGLNLLG